MSELQSQAAVFETVNDLFDPEKTVDINTLPAPNNINRTEEYFEAMILAGIVTEIMASSNEEETVITQANDGSKKSGVGSYIVQSFIINGKQRSLPVMPIFTESKASLQDLEMTTLQILSAASAKKYSEAQILE